MYEENGTEKSHITYQCNLGCLQTLLQSFPVPLSCRGLAPAITVQFYFLGISVHVDTMQAIHYVLYKWGVLWYVLTKSVAEIYIRVNTFVRTTHYITGSFLACLRLAFKAHSIPVLYKLE